MPTQELTWSAVKTLNIMDIEKKYRIHFPLAQISTPIVTYLVTDYDLSPNLLRADIDAKNGGWLVVSLTGQKPQLESALSWLREQGLDVEEDSGQKVSVEEN